jgi:hypothetical protein
MTNGYVVTYQKARYWWTIETDRVSINIGAYQGVTLFLDPTNDRIRTIVMELKSTNGSPGCYVTDLNGDGIPDQKQIKGTWERQIFYQGKFVTLMSTNDESCIMENGQLKPVHFVGDHWELKRK